MRLPRRLPANRSPLLTGKRMTLATAPDSRPIAPGPAARFGSIASRLSRRPAAVFGVVVILVVVIAAISAPLVAPYPPNEQLFDGLTLEGAPLPPNADFLFGTDLLGCDLF